MSDDPRPKYFRLSQEIETSIRVGQWEGGRVPSVRGIAQAHGVSVVTASRALQVLRDKGLITTIDRSGNYVAGGDAPAGERYALCLRVTPGQFQHVSDSLTRQGFEAQLQREGVVLADNPFDFTAPSPRSLLRQARQVVATGLRGLFLMPARVSEEAARVDEELLAACQTASLPVVLVERNLRGPARPLAHDLVGTDDVAGAAALTRHLLDRGRKRVAIVVASPVNTHEDRVAGYLAALHAAGRFSPLVLNERTDGSRKAAYARLADELVATRADGVVCYSDYTAIGVMLEMFARGVRVPQDVALTGFDDLPLGNQFAVGITTYALPAAEMARHALRLMRPRTRGADAPPVRIVVPGRMIVRESTGGEAG